LEYLLIEKKIRDMIVYNNIMLRQFPKFEKYLLANKIRELGYEILSLVITINKKFHKKTTLTELNIKHEILRQLINLSAELRYKNIYKNMVNKKQKGERK
jgi:hypothetical protein